MKKILRFLKIIGSIILILSIIICVLFGYRDIPINDLKEKYAQKPSLFTNIKGIDVHFRDEGEKIDSIPIVLIHGTGSSLHTFDDWGKKLKHKYRIIRMDLPGYGLSGPFPEGNYTIDNYISFIKMFLDELGVEKCIVGGNSLGGNIAWRFTLENNKMVEKLLLIDASGYPMKSKSTPLAFKIAETPILKTYLLL
jgi:pimeloyl-ACP methyl ester carboxylesterase